MRDVTVRGAGVFGLAVGFACLERGARVRVIDPGGPGGGASGGIVGALAPHTPDGWNEKKAFQFACLAEAEARWARIAAASGKRTGYARTGRLQPLPTERALEIAKARAEDAALNWGAGFQWEIREAPGPEGWAPPSPTGAWLYDSLSARIHPRRACEALAAAISALGGSVVREGADRGGVVHATGWEGLLALSEALGRPIGGGVKGQAVLLQAEAPEGLPQIFAEGLHMSCPITMERWPWAPPASATSIRRKGPMAERTNWWRACGSGCRVFEGRRLLSVGLACAPAPRQERRLWDVGRAGRGTSLPMEVSRLALGSPGALRISSRTW